MIRLQREGCFDEKILRFGCRQGAAVLEAKVAKQRGCQNDRGDTQVDRPQVGSECELDLVLAGRQIHAAHEEVAAKELCGSAVHKHLPVGIESIIQQEHGS